MIRNFCKMCGARLGPDAEFCPACGCRLEPQAGRDSALSGTACEGGAPNTAAAPAVSSPAASAIPAAQPEPNAVPPAVPEAPGAPAWQPAGGADAPAPGPSPAPGAAPLPGTAGAPAPEAMNVPPAPQYSSYVQNIGSAPPAQTPPPYPYAPGSWGYGMPVPPELISTGGYLGMFLISMIPIVGLIYLIIQAAGNPWRPNRRNFARGLLAAQAIAIAVVYGLVILVGILIGMTGYYYY